MAAVVRMMRAAGYDGAHQPPLSDRRFRNPASVCSGRRGSEGARCRPEGPLLATARTLHVTATWRPSTRSPWRSPSSRCAGAGLRY